MIRTLQYQELQDEFKTLITAKNYSGIATTYTTPIEELLMWLEQKGITNINKVKTITLVQYYEMLNTRPNKRRGGKLAQSTINGHLFSMRLFFDYLLENNMIKKGFSIPKFKLMKTQERQSLTEPEVQELYAACETKQEKALLSVAYGCGLRRKEMHFLDSASVQFHSGILIVVSGKGNKRREVPMSDGVIRYLRDYNTTERSNYLKYNNLYEAAFFVNNKGKRMDGGHMNNILKKIINRTNNNEIISKNITLHCLRHSLAEHLLNRGAGLELIKNLLGHSLLDTAAIYAIKQRRKRILTIS